MVEDVAGVHTNITLWEKPFPRRHDCINNSKSGSKSFEYYVQNIIFEQMIETSCCFGIGFVPTCTCGKVLLQVNECMHAHSPGLFRRTNGVLVAVNLQDPDCLSDSSGFLRSVCGVK